jgi:hypothetical protein
MTPIVLIPWTAALLLVTSATIGPRQVPPFRALWQPVFNLLRQLRRERRPARPRSMAMRGARPWWE